MESSPPWHIPRAVYSPRDAVAASLFCKPELVPFSLMYDTNNCTGEHTSKMLAQPLWRSALSTPDPTGGVGC